MNNQGHAGQSALQQCSLRCPNPKEGASDEFDERLCNSMLRLLAEAADDGVAAFSDALIADLSRLLRWELPESSACGEVFCELDAACKTVLSCITQPAKREHFLLLMLALHRCVCEAVMDTGRSTVEQLSRRNALLCSLASEDTLTGLYNRRGFHEAAESTILAPLNRGKRALLAFVDMDNLKMTNDTFGHEEGNRALRLISTALKDCFGNDSIIGRVGGDEFNVFVLLRPDEHVDTFRTRLKTCVTTICASVDLPYEITVSAGFNEIICGADVRLNDCLLRADCDMYTDKSSKPPSIFRSGHAAL